MPERKHNGRQLQFQKAIRNSDLLTSLFLIIHRRLLPTLKTQRIPGTPRSPEPPKTPDAVTPDDLDLTISNGGFGKRVSLQIEGGHWLTIQVRHVGSIAITSVQVPGSGLVTMSLSAPVGSMLQVWETEAEMTFTNGVPNNPILSTAVRQL